MKRKLLCALLMASIGTTSAFAESIGKPPELTAFSYQGQLEAGGALANGTYQFTFTLYTAPKGGMPVGGTFPIHQQIIVVDGVFTTDLNFGQAFNGKPYWLEIMVGSASTGMETLSSRQAVTAVPVAQYALNSPAGAAGPAGPTGPAGPMGADGKSGAIGPEGKPGPAGVAGDKGAAGPAGPIGATGAVGATGPAGPIGQTGARGADGAAGTQGSAGPAGSPGQVGPVGPAGSPGLVGPVGPAGSPGQVGPVGPAGSPGQEGPVGPAGSPGQVGQVGPAGSPGPVGPAGIPGEPGAVGPAGSPGQTGPAGTAGMPGEQGPAGPIGSEGVVGPAGPQGDAGLIGATGPQGDTGPTGATGAGQSIVLNTIIPKGNGSGVDGSSAYVVSMDAVANEGNAIFIMPVDCAYPKLRVVAQAGISASYNFTLLRYAGPLNTEGEGSAVAGTGVDAATRYSSTSAEMTIAAGDGYSIRMDGNASSATTSAIAVSLSCN